MPNPNENTIQDNLKASLNAIRKISEDMHGAAIINRRGLALAEDIGGENSKRLGAMIVAFLGTAKQISATVMGGAPISQSFFRTTEYTIYVYAISGEHVLAVLAGNDAPEGLIDWVIKDSDDSITARLRNILGGSESTAA